MTMKFWTVRAALFALAAAITAPAVGGTLPPIMLVTKLGYLEARPDMFKSPYDATRQQSPNGFYAASGDFDGDGKADEARLLIDRAGKNAVLVIVIDHGPNIKTYGFDKMKATQLGSLGIKVAPPGTYRLANPAGGVTTKTIGDLLGHRSAESTRPYLKLATDDLREVALEIPGQEVQL